MSAAHDPEPVPVLGRLPSRPFPPPSRTTAGWLRGFAIAGGAAFVAGLFFAPARVWPNFLLSVYFLAGLGLAGAVFLALHYVTGARWSVPIRRVPEAMVCVLPWAGIAMAALAFGAPTLYAWADGATVAADGTGILSERSGWMNVPFFLARVAVVFGAWIALAGALVRRSRRQDEDGDPVHRSRNARTSAVFLVVFGVTFSLACFDWIMSLESHWFSTIFAIYNFSGLFLSGIAAITILVILLRRRGTLASVVTDDVLHDLGKLLFGFSLFWGYIWFSQYMLIWYVNNPEETVYYQWRHAGAWQPVSIANVLLNWAIPFAVLLPAGAKRRETVLLRVSAIVLLGRWVDLYLMVVQPSAGADPIPSVWDLLLPAGAVAVFLLLWWRSMGRAPVVPLRDPAYPEPHGA